MITLYIRDTLDYDQERCPYCDEYKLYLEFDETELNGTPTGTGTHVHCKNELDVSDPNYNPNDHSDMPYVYWLPVQRRAADWAAANVRVVWVDDRQRLADWNAGKPLPGGMR